MAYSLFPVGMVLCNLAAQHNVVTFSELCLGPQLHRKPMVKLPFWILLPFQLSTTGANHQLPVRSWFNIRGVPHVADKIGLPGQMKPRGPTLMVAWSKGDHNLKGAILSTHRDTVQRSMSPMTNEKACCQY